jgi:beta-glucosidase
MTLEEKVGQMNIPTMNSREMGRDIDEKRAASRSFAEGSYVEGLGPAGGFFGLANNALPGGALQQAKFFNELQRIAVGKSRMKIPLLQIDEGTHGLMCPGGTIFPEGPALGSTWNLELIEKVYAATAREARALGIHLLNTLVVEPNRDPRLGRNIEGYSEDTYMCALIAETIVRAMQGTDISAEDKVVASLCHFPGQSEPVGGLERGAMEMSKRVLVETFLPPWIAGLQKAGGLSVMATYPAINGVPVHASIPILTTLLRDELGFEGIVLGEGGGINTLVYEGLARNQKEAGILAIKAGVDVGISFEDGYMRALVESVREGIVSEELVDRAVRRILRLKYNLGLFDNPFVDPEKAKPVVNSKEHQELALQAAREGIVLLKNENNLLPLKKDLGAVAVIGPNADHELNQLGDYVARWVLQDVVTVLEGVRATVSPKTKVTYVRGCEVIGDELDEIEAARDAALASDVAIVALGENEWQTEGQEGTSGEAFDVANLDLTGMQQDLVKAVVETGTPTVVVLINGRPLSTRWIAEHVPAVVEAWLPGELGGTAVAEILFGDYNPSGRLTLTVPRHSGQLPVYYNYKKSKTYWMEEGWGVAYADMPASPLYEFGFGISYTQFEYSGLRVLPAETSTTGSVGVVLTVANVGDRFGEEVVQLYVRDPVSSVATPEIQLRGYRKVGLAAGEEKQVRFSVGPEDLKLLDQEMNWIVEPGEFQILVGHSSRDIRLRGAIKVLE